MDRSLCSNAGVRGARCVPHIRPRAAQSSYRRQATNQYNRPGADGRGVAALAILRGHGPMDGGTMTLALDRIECPIGTINVVAGPSALIALDFGDCTDR